MKPTQPFSAFVFLLALFSLIGSAVAQERVALVIGINDYPENSNFPDLKNCVNDARLISRTLQSVGFEVIEATDCNLSGMEEKLSEFRNKIPQRPVNTSDTLSNGAEFACLNGQSFKPFG